MSNLIEIAGFVAVVDATYGLAGRWWATLVAGAFLLFIGAATDDRAVAGAVRRVGLAPRKVFSGVLRANGRRRARRAGAVPGPSSSPHPAPPDLRSDPWYQAAADLLARNGSDAVEAER